MRRDRNFHSTNVSTIQKIPRLHDLSLFGGITGHPGQEGNIIVNRDNQAFYGHNGSMWVPLSSPGPQPLAIFNTLGPMRLGCIHLVTPKGH